MDTHNFTEHRILIWGKTYPEISVKYYETVCTGGVLEDGSFVRLYPIPFRYLTDGQTFTKYQWIRARIKKSNEDHRPESYKIDAASIMPEGNIPTDKFRWFDRSIHVFKNEFYQFPTVDTLLEANKKKKTSMGFIRPAFIDKIELENRPEKDNDTYLRKISANQEKLKQQQLFPLATPAELKKLQFLSSRFKVHWRCHEPKCLGHNMSILDWEVYELARIQGTEKTLTIIREKLDLAKYDVGFFLGSLKAYPNWFAIGGIWYPQKTHLARQASLVFD